MRRAVVLLGAAVTLLCSAVALGQEQRSAKVRLSVEPKIGITILGFETPTGGLSGGAGREAVEAGDASAASDTYAFHCRGRPARVTVPPPPP